MDLYLSLVRVHVLTFLDSTHERTGVSMKNILTAIMALAISACGIPTAEDIEGQFGRAVDECRSYVQLATSAAEERAWGICVDYYENQAIPDIENILEEEVQALQAWFELQVEEMQADLESRLLSEYGCEPYEDNGTLTWNCVNSPLCEEAP